LPPWDESFFVATLALTHAAELKDLEGMSVYACACLLEKYRVSEFDDLQRTDD
jgi:hypothetical protein